MGRKGEEEFGLVELGSFPLCRHVTSLDAPSDRGVSAEVRLVTGSLVFIINSYFQSNKGANSSRKNKEMSNPGSDISAQCSH